MDLGAIAALTSAVLTLLLSQTRIFYAMAHDGLLPSFFAKIHRNTETPWISTLISGIHYYAFIKYNVSLFSGGSCAIISGIFPVDIVGDASSIGALITYLFVHIEVIIVSAKL